MDRAAATLKLLADPTRIKVLCALLQGESSVSCLAELVGASPTAVSQHLAKLRLAGLVKPRRDGAFVYYLAVDGSLQRVLAEALGWQVPQSVPTSVSSRPLPASRVTITRRPVAASPTDPR